MIYGLVGERLSHSFSPLIHKLIWDCDYSLMPMSREAFVQLLESGDFDGINVTIPYKKIAHEKCDVLDEYARSTGSVNTVVRKDGLLYGYNTDCAGFLYCANRAGIDFNGKKVLVLGSGGTNLTAREVVSRCAAAQCVTVSRSGEDNYTNLSRHFDSDVIINTTPVGMYPENGIAPIDLKPFERCESVIDMIYNPLKTRLLSDAEMLGKRATNGLPMLVMQAVRAAEIFSGRQFDEQCVQRVLSEVKRLMTNIVLVGMPGCGKSVIGAQLAKRLDRELVDTDAEIEKRAGMTVPEIFSAFGEERFRELEREETARCGARSGVVISCGGGAVMSEENRRALSQNGRVYYIDRRLSALARDGRPLSLASDSLAQLYQSRAPLYREAAAVTVDNNLSVDVCAQRIAADFSEKDWCS